MILVKNGQNLTSTATEDEVLFTSPDEEGNQKPAGRQQFCFEMISGTIQCEVGKAVNTSLATSHSTTANSKWIMTLDPQDFEGGFRNLRVVGVGVVAVSW